jgi:hypothetical protein
MRWYEIGSGRSWLRSTSFTFRSFTFWLGDSASYHDRGLGRHRTYSQAFFGALSALAHESHTDQDLRHRRIDSQDSDPSLRRKRLTAIPSYVASLANPYLDSSSQADLGYRRRLSEASDSHPPISPRLGYVHSMAGNRHEASDVGHETVVDHATSPWHGGLSAMPQDQELAEWSADTRVTYRLAERLMALGVDINELTHEMDQWMRDYREERANNVDLEQEILRLHADLENVTVQLAAISAILSEMPALGRYLP